jgi:hypothetical protein
MSCCPSSPPAIELPCAFKGATWDGLTWRVDSTDGTDYDAVLSSARFQLQDSTGAAVLTLTNDPFDLQITLNVTTPRLWSVTVEKRLLTLDAGIYSWALETTDADSTIKVQLIGTLTVKPDLIL